MIILNLGVHKFYMYLIELLWNVDVWMQEGMINL